MSKRKLKITKVHPRVVEEERQATLCPSCSGSGFYDSWDTKRNRAIKCSACRGTGMKLAASDL